MSWYLAVIKKYAQFSGRARRKEYWMFFLFNTIFSIVASILDNIVFGTSIEGFGYIYILYVLFAIIPSLAVGVRRLHDIGKSGWWLLISLIPIVGLWLLVLLITDSQHGTNQYGSTPKEVNFTA